MLIFEVGSNLFELLEFVNVFGCRFPGLVDNVGVYGTYRVPHPEAPYPQDYVIDQEGKIAYWSVEYDPQEVIRVIDRLLEQGSNLAIQLDPVNPPIVIPAGGGSFDYNISVTSGSTSMTFEVWCMATLPNGSPFGPVLGPVSVTLPAGVTIDRDRTQVVPGGAPAGDYTYDAYAGTYPNVVLDSDSFPFMKTGVTTSKPPYVEWRNTGDPFDDEGTHSEAIPDAYSLIQNHPNPFNPVTTIRFDLPQASHVRLAVYDLQGRVVAELVNGIRDASLHTVTWDASNLASGLYFYRIEAGNFASAKKMVLMK